MSSLQVWLAIAGITVATVVTRAAPLFVQPSVKLGERWSAALRYAPACALAAVIFPDLLFVHGQLSPGWSNPRLLAGMVAIALCLVTRGTLTTIGGGMLAYWLLLHVLHG